MKTKNKTNKIEEERKKQSSEGHNLKETFVVLSEGKIVKNEDLATKTLN